MMDTPVSLQKILIPEAGQFNPASGLAAQIKSPLFVAQLLLMRGIEQKEQARQYFLPSLEPSPHPPLRDLETACGLLCEAKKKNQKVVVHGDYDVDGISATALVYLGLKKLGFDADWFLPNRFKEGYGISEESVKAIAKTGANWIVTVDTGVSAHKPVQYANELGINVIITDHHQTNHPLPPAKAVVNPNRPDCLHPSKDLAGVGVAFRLIECLFGILLNRSAEEFLDLVALGSLADLAPMNRQNRGMVRTGLRQISSGARPGIKALLQQLNLEGVPIGSGEVIFRIAPLLNAAGRLGEASLALDLLLADNEGKAKILSQNLKRENIRRQNLDQKITAEAIAQAEAIIEKEDPPCLVLYSEDWHEGVIGIVAARVVERFNRPSFILGGSKNNTAKGSGRTPEGLDIFEAIQATSSLFLNWGGHEAACGFSIARTNIEAFRKEINQHVDSISKKRDCIPQIKPELWISSDEISEDSLIWLSRFEPFGRENEKPLFYSDNLVLTGPPKIVGETHLKFSIRCKDGSIDAIGFGMANFMSMLCEKPNGFSAAFFVEWNIFRGRRKPQLRIVGLE